MYISELKLWNFRKFGKDGFDLSDPHAIIPFKKGINVLIGENDTGKTAIIDAIKYVLKTNTNEYIKIQHDDFHKDSTRLRIEMLVDEMSALEARHFTDCIIPVAGKSYFQLRLVLDVGRKDGQVQPYDICGGATDSGKRLDASMKSKLRVTYLKPLRDAENELTAKKNSRLSQILQAHELLQENIGDKKHEFIGIVDEANLDIESWFERDEGEKSNKKQIKDVIDGFLHQFINQDHNSVFSLADPTMRNILERLAIGIVDKRNLGLGSMNRLFMATELLHLRKADDSLKVCLIEELEAHIHPQAQMKVIKGLQGETAVQFILTTHSPNITSKIKLDDENNSFLMCNDKGVFPLGPGNTKLDKKDYTYLDHFLDVTKSNLFFAKGMILVEGWAEEILLPVIAENIGIDLTQKEISIINVGSTAYLHFARIFAPANGTDMGVRCAIVTDLDVKPDDDDKEETEKSKKESIDKAMEDMPESVKPFLASEWTLEWCLYKSSKLSELFKESIAEVHSRTSEFKFDKDSKKYHEGLEAELIRKLKEKKLDKVAVASKLANKIKDSKLDLTANDDEYIQYLIDSIKFAVGE